MTAVPFKTIWLWIGVWIAMGVISHVFRDYMPSWIGSDEKHVGDILTLVIFNAGLWVHCRFRIGGSP